ncbi:DUF1345 domain-containing protein [Micromonospora sp. NBC_00858]|uniref:DUF1345 domain-containing protein n=1 Tax=Micromonospora sp. NBC_00858 TaxID=2975979 RepID=UPI00386F90F7
MLSALPDGRAAQPVCAGAATYRDLAYVAFTIGMTYQVSDTAISDPRIRGVCCPMPSCRAYSAW